MSRDFDEVIKDVQVESTTEYLLRVAANANYKDWLGGFFLGLTVAAILFFTPF